MTPEATLPRPLEILSDYFGVCSKVLELLATGVKFAHQRLEFGTINRCLNIEIEAVLKFALGDEAAL